MPGRLGPDAIRRGSRSTAVTRSRSTTTSQTRRRRARSITSRRLTPRRRRFSRAGRGWITRSRSSVRPTRSSATARCCRPSRTRRARRRLARGIRRRPIASSRVAMSACRTTPTPTSSITATSACSRWTRVRCSGPVTVTGNGAHTVEYRSTDVAGNVEATKKVDFTIGAAGGDTTAPVTTSSLTPATPGAGGTYNGQVSVQLSATDPATRPAVAATPKTVDVNAFPDHWEPNALNATVGDTVRWNFPAATAGTVHDVHLIKPGEAPTSAGTQHRRDHRAGRRRRPPRWWPRPGPTRSIARCTRTGHGRLGRHGRHGHRRRAAAARPRAPGSITPSTASTRAGRPASGSARTTPARRARS